MNKNQPKQPEPIMYTTKLGHTLDLLKASKGFLKTQLRYIQSTGYNLEFVDTFKRLLKGNTSKKRTTKPKRDNSNLTFIPI